MNKSIKQFKIYRDGRKINEDLGNQTWTDKI